ncbi:MAG TPA: amidase family protein [Gemmatimonadaceae bacterium]|jgi:Asp-tRNA(Asn)/Glu-tRNA(Gln) amidotransferase A subunit family amidase
MMKVNSITIASLLLATVSATLPGQASAAEPFRVEETSIADVHAAMQAGRLTCHGLVEQYLRRIDAYDKNGPALNAIVVVNPAALRVADSLDARFRRDGLTGPLHCIPVIVKDNFETVDLPTTAGSLSMQGFVSNKDAFQVRRLREAGAIILAKSNMAEFAFSPYETVNSILPGYTKNPYALDRVTAGSSGGTAAAVSADLGEVGLGTDTGNSIRGPSSHQALVGIRSTMGLTSRAGIVPLNLSADIAGPMARTVADAVAVFQVIVGYDPADSATVASRNRPIPNYSASLVRDGLRGARIGILRQAYERPTLDPEIRDVFARAVAELRLAGATVIDSVPLPGLDSLFAAHRGQCNPFKYDLERWIANTGNRTPVKSLEEIIKSGRYHPSIQKRLELAQAVDQSPEQNPGCKDRDQFRDGFRAMVLRAMDSAKLDALIYPTWSNPPRLIGDLNTPAGDNSQLFSPSTGWPAITVPMGYTRGTLPAGMTLFGRAWSEPTLIRLAYGYEQATHQRHPPSATPPLR